MVTPCIK